MEGQEDLAEELTDEVIDDHMSDILVRFRRQAEAHGMHEQVMALSERYMRRAFRRGHSRARSPR